MLYPINIICVSAKWCIPVHIETVRHVLHQYLNFGDSNMASNYHSISTLSAFNKIFEKFIHLRLFAFLTSNNDILIHSLVFYRNIILVLKVFTWLQTVYLSGFIIKLTKHVYFWIYVKHLYCRCTYIFLSEK